MTDPSQLWRPLALALVALLVGIGAGIAIGAATSGGDTTTVTRGAGTHGASASEEAGTEVSPSGERTATTEEPSTRPEPEHASGEPLTGPSETAPSP